MAISYSSATNTVTVTGYTSGTPCTFNDLWLADKAGTLTLDSRTGISATDASPDSFSINLKPADYGVLGGARQDLYITVANWTDMTSATIQITGTDSNGSAQTEDIEVTDNGTYYATKYFKTLTASQVTAFDGTGSFDYDVIQGQWGVISGFGYYNTGGWGHPGYAQYLLEARIIIGDGSTATYFADESRNITINSYLSGGYAILVKSAAYFTLGKLIDATDKTTYGGCSIIGLADDGQDVYLRFESGSTGAFYSCMFTKFRYNYYSIAQSVVISGTPTSMRIWNCRGDLSTAQNIQNFDMYNVEVRLAGRAIINQPSTGNTYDKISVFGTSYIYTSDMYRTVTISNLYARDCTYVFSPTNAGGYDHYLINPDIDNWAFNWGTTWGKIYRQYSFDLTVRDDNGDPLNGATVVLLDKNGNQLFTTTTDANGKITTQTVTYGYYTRETGDTLNGYAPFTLKVYKLGYRTYYDASLEIDGKWKGEVATIKRPW
jgi:hypothetical protein